MLAYTVVCPGRVNIIGEHVDHQNYPVFPCAIKQSIEVKVEQYEASEAAPALAIYHKDLKFESAIFENVCDIKIIPGKHCWYNYLIASYFGVCEYMYYGRSLVRGHSIDRYKGLPSGFWEHPSDPELPCLRKYKLTVGGEGVPQAAGLSSSSALTCSGSIAWLVRRLGSNESPDTRREGTAAGSPGLKLVLTRKEIAHVSAHGEGYSGTASGGMDQAAICLSQAGSALYINFKPLTSESVKLPREIALVIANCGRAAPKAVSAAKMYNKRVFELKCACYIILKKHGKSLSCEDLIVNGLRDVLRMIGMSEDEFLASELDDCLKPEVYTRQDIEKLVDESTRTFLLEKRCGASVWTQNDDFHCYQRVRHVLTENARVLRCVELCRKYGDSSATPPEVLEEMGKLLDGSFASLNGDFDCGCDELRELVRVCKNAGAYGSRLTGAGWGGCTVSLVHKDRVEAFMQEVQKNFFEPIITGSRKIEPPLEHMVSSIDQIRNVLFASEPSQPARVILEQ